MLTTTRCGCSSSELEHPYPSLSICKICLHDVPCCCYEGDKVSVAAVTRHMPHHVTCPTLALTEVCPDDAAEFISIACERATAVISTVPPGPNGDQVLPILRPHLKNAPFLSRMIYVSSTSVYGDYLGHQVTEHATPMPNSAKARARRKAELEWCATSNSRGMPHIVLMRLSGVYGVERCALHAVLREKHDSSDHMIVSRIHVDDAVAALIAATLLPGSVLFTNGAHPLIVNVADDEPASRNVVFAYAKALLSRCAKPYLPFNESNQASSARSKSTRAANRTNKRVSNLFMKHLLSIHLLYPTFREGLTAIAREEFGFETQRKFGSSPTEFNR